MSMNKITHFICLHKLLVRAMPVLTTCTRACAPRLNLKHIPFQIMCLFYLDTMELKCSGLAATKSLSNNYRYVEVLHMMIVINITGNHMEIYLSDRHEQ